MAVLQDDLVIQQQHWINGRHYSLTLEAWLQRQDSQKAKIMPIMSVRIPFPYWLPFGGKISTKSEQALHVPAKCRDR